MKIKNGDFIEMDFIGRIKDTNDIFDLTVEDVAKKEGLHRKDTQYKPLILQVGKNEVIKGLDEFLVEKEVGKEYDVEIAPEKAFGKRDNRLLQLVSLGKFRDEKINPFPGLQVMVNGIPGIVKTVNSGRIIVDFNHPLAGRNLIYHLKIVGIVTDVKKKINGVLRNYLGFEDERLEIANDIITLHQEVNESFLGKIKDRLKEIMPSLKEVKCMKEEVQKAKKQGEQKE